MFDFDSTQMDVPQVYSLTMYKAATLKMHVRATNITNFDFLTVSYSYGVGGYGPVLNGRRTIDTTLIYKTAGDIPTYIQWDAVGNGVNISEKDSLIVPAGEERTYDIRL